MNNASTLLDLGTVSETTMGGTHAPIGDSLTQTAGFTVSM